MVAGAVFPLDASLVDSAIGVDDRVNEDCWCVRSSAVWSWQALVGIDGVKKRILVPYVDCAICGHCGRAEGLRTSAPKHAGKGVICPLAAISAVQMMCDELAMPEAAARIDSAMSKALTSGEIQSLATNSGMKTSEFTDVVLSHMN